jgi:multidrug efflux pump subunit AcrB
MENTYQTILKGFMRVRWVAFILIIACGTVAYWINNTLKTELAPMEDRSQFRVQLTLPEGTSFDATDKFVDRVTNFVLDSVPEKEMILSLTAPGFSSGSANTGMVRVTLVDPSERERSQKKIVEMVTRNMSRYNDGRANVSEQATIAVDRRSSGNSVSFVIQNNNFDKLTAILPKFLEKARESKILLNADADLKFNKPELRVEVDRLKAAQLGVSVEDISQTLQLAYSNRRFGYFTKDGKQYQVMGQVARNDRDDPNDLKSLYVRNSRNEMIGLDNLVTVTEGNTPPSIYHFNRFKSATITAQLQPGFTIGDGIVEMQDIAKGLLDETFTTSLSGASRDLVESSSNAGLALGLALALIFLVLAAQFESFIDPFIIMFTVPLAIAGAMLSLWAFGQTWNIFSQIGVIMLIGMVTKNGILIVEFANQNQDKGMKKMEAAVFAATQRLRPILMTNLAMALGALPLALSLGAAATSRIPLGIVIVGGILFSLFLTLFVIPAMYSFMATKRKKSPIEILLDENGNNNGHHDQPTITTIDPNAGTKNDSNTPNA